MDTPAVLYATRWLIRDTFCQALASRVFAVMLGANVVFILFCLGVSVEGPRSLKEPGDTELFGADDKPLTGPNRHTAHMSLLFGLIRVELFRDAETQVHFLQAFFSSWVAGVTGVILSLLWMAGFFPDSLQTHTAAVQMVRPVPLWVFVVGKYLGVIAFVAFQATVFFVGTWLALGVKTGIWLPSYLLGIPLLVLHFAAFYSVSIYLATLTRSTMACALGSMLFWFLCLGINYGRFAAVSLPFLAPGSLPLSTLTGGMLEVSYWVLPKPADFLIALEELLGLSSHQATLASLPEFRVAIDHGAFEPGWSIVSTLAFTIVMLVLSSWQLKKNEY